VILYAHVRVFNNLHDVVYYLWMNIGFLFIEALIVAFIFDRILDFREKQSLLKKLNMVIGAFFSEAGTVLMKKLYKPGQGGSESLEYLSVGVGWKKHDFLSAKKKLKSSVFELDLSPEELMRLKEFLLPKREFFLRLMENPNLLEHESFTDLLWSVFHLTEELEARNEIKNLPSLDTDHIVNDSKRVYVLLLREWLSYMEHLKNDYPYLFSLAARTNPFNPNASVIVK
jgi:hypothetical protein